MSAAPRNLFVDERERAAKALAEWRAFITHQIRGGGRRIRQRMNPSWQSLWKLQKGLCWLCGKPLSNSFVSRDHLHPKSKGGTGKPHNVLLAHKTCNGKRGNKGIYTREEALAHLEKLLGNSTGDLPMEGTKDL